MTNIAWLSIGITAPTISLFGTLILFYVAFNDGRKPNLIFLYIIKKSITLTLEITFFGREILDIWSGNVQLDQGFLAIFMFCLCGVFAPVFFAFVAYKYFLFIKDRDQKAKWILQIYKDLAKKEQKNELKSKQIRKVRKVKKI